MRGLFITGAGTEVGKTHVACRIAESLRARKAAGVDVTKFDEIQTEDAPNEGAEEDARS